MRFLVLLLLVGYASAAVDVPAERQVEFKKCVWVAGGEFGDGNKKKPDYVGRIEARQIVWNKQFYDVETYEEKPDKSVVLSFELGTLTLTWKDDNHIEGKFVDKQTNALHVFRTNGGWKP